jgi:translation initiation factor 2B subunit (eIF-2B alpha/beta/delta family)
MSDGILNTGGSLALAMLARYFGIPFIVVAASYKLWSPAVWEAERPHAEQMQRPETGPQAVGTTGVASEINYAYDVIPMDFVHGLVSDVGVFMPPGDLSTLFSQDSSDLI